MITLPQRLSAVMNMPAFDPILRQRIGSWQEDQFRKFLIQYEDKIVSKFAPLLEYEDQRDIGLELFVARMFSSNNCTVVYEPDRDGPDFLLILDDESFYCEVRRIRENLPPPSQDWEEYDFPPNLCHKIGDVLCEKFLQMKPGRPNVIYIRSNRFLLQKVEFDSAITSLMDLAIDHQVAFFRIKGFRDELHFADQASLCSAIVFHHFWTDVDTDKPYFVSLNASASEPLSPKLVQLLHAAADMTFKP